MKQSNSETGDLIFLCRDKDGKFSKQIKVRGLLNKINELEKRINSQFGTNIDSIVALWEQKFHTCLISKLFFLYMGMDVKNLNNINDCEKYQLIPLAAELEENWIFINEQLINHPIFESATERNDFLQKYKDLILFLLKIQFVVNKKDEKANILSDMQKKNLDNIAYNVMNLFNSIIDDKQIPNDGFMSMCKGNDFFTLFFAFLADTFVYMTIPDGSKELRFDIATIESIDTKSKKEIANQEQLRTAKKLF